MKTSNQSSQIEKVTSVADGIVVEAGKRAKNLSSMEYTPTYITESKGGYGFVEMVSVLLD